eukprot:3536401-Ditylum_brightwellii.AAC.1
MPWPANLPTSKLVWHMLPTQPPPIAPHDIDDGDLCTKTIVELSADDGNKSRLLCLFDTGASGKVGAFIKRSALANIPHTINETNG